MSDIDALAGLLRVRPGRTCPQALVSTRRDWADALTRGQPAGAVPARLASVYSLCGQAHRFCADLALQAAAGRAAAIDGRAREALRSETLREHLRRILLDWPQRLAPPAARAAVAAQGLRAAQDSPAWSAAGGTEPVDLADATYRWLEAELLGAPADAWLAGWERDGAAWLTQWSDAGAGWLATLLRQVRPLADAAALQDAPLRVHADAAALSALAARLRGDAGFTCAPQWQGACAETGCWTRLHDAAAAAPRLVTAWVRLGARLAEAVRLALPEASGRSGAGWLAAGALPLARGEGLAWVEMARGLLLHWLHTDADTQAPRVLGCRVLAPTEWNFHPKGGAARAIAALRPGAPPAALHQVDVLMAAYDPCVRFEVELPSTAGGAAYA